MENIQTWRDEWYGPRSEESLVKLTKQNEDLSSKLDGIESAVWSGSAIVALALFAHAAAFWLKRK